VPVVAFRGGLGFDGGDRRVRQIGEQHPTAAAWSFTGRLARVSAVTVEVMGSRFLTSWVNGLIIQNEWVRE
jgi:hypothetical protein